MDSSIKPEVEDVDFDDLDDEELFSKEDMEAYLSYLEQDGY